MTEKHAKSRTDKKAKKDKPRWKSYYLVHGRLKFESDIVMPGLPVNMVDGLYVEYVVVKCLVADNPTDPSEKMINLLLPNGGITFKSHMSPGDVQGKFEDQGLSKLHSDSCLVRVALSPEGGSGIESSTINGWADVNYSPLVTDDVKGMFLSGGKERFRATGTNESIIWKLLDYTSAEEMEQRLYGVRYLIDRMPVLLPNFLYRTHYDYHMDHTKGRTKQSCWAVPTPEELHYARKKMGKVKAVSTGFLDPRPIAYKDGFYGDNRISESIIQDRYDSMKDYKLISSSGKLLSVDAVPYLFPKVTWFRGDSLYDLDLFGARRAQALLGTSAVL